MKVECLKSVIRLKFHKFVLILDVIEDELYLSGNRIDKNRSVRTYNKAYIKENTCKYPKKTILQLAFNNEVLIVDYSDSGKFYFRYWNSIKNFYKWRHEATDTYMFKMDWKTKNKVFFKNDFTIPIYTWESKTEPQNKVTTYETNIS